MDPVLFRELEGIRKALQRIADALEAMAKPDHVPDPDDPR